MAVRPYFSPPVTPTVNGKPAFFDQPAPGALHVIRNVIVQDLGILGAGDVLTVQKLPDGIVFAMGVGTNNPMSTGAHQLINPVQQRAGENVWLQPPPIATAVTPTGAGSGSGNGIMHPSGLIPAGELLIVAAGDLNGSAISNQGIADTENNSYTSLATITTTAGGLTVAECDVTQPLSTSDSIQWTASGYVPSETVLAAITAAGASRSAPAYATAHASGSSGTAAVSSSAPIATGDLAVLIAANNALNPAPGGSWTQQAGTTGTGTRLFIFTHPGAGAVVSASWATSNLAWMGVITAIPSAASTGYGSLAVSLSGQEADLRMGV